MQVNAVSNTLPSISKQSFGDSYKVALPNKIEEKTDKAEFSAKEAPKEEVKTSDKILKGVSSFLVPGFGQLANEENSKAARHFVASAALAVAPIVAYTQGALRGSRALLGISGLISAAGLAQRIISGVDAAKNAKADN